MWPKIQGDQKKKLDEEDKEWYIIKVFTYIAKGKDGYDCLKVDKKAKPVGDQTFGDEEVKGEPGTQSFGDKRIKGKYFTVTKD